MPGQQLMNNLFLISNSSWSNPSNLESQICFWYLCPDILQVWKPQNIENEGFVVEK